MVKSYVKRYTRRLRGKSVSLRSRAAADRYANGIRFGGALRGSAAGVIRRRVNRFKPRSRKNVSGRIVVPTAQGGATSNSYCGITHVIKKKSAATLMKYVGAPNYYVKQLGQQIGVEQGFQNAAAFGWNTGLELAALLNTVPQSTPGGGVLIPKNYKCNRYELSKMTGELLITNSSLASAYVEIYDIVCKRDSTATLSADAQYMTDPTVAWQQGIEDIANDATSDLWRTIKALPFDSQVFNTWFKVVKRHHIGMPQGATHRHTVNLDVNKILDGELLMIGTNQPNVDTPPNPRPFNLRGLTMFSMVVAYGQPISVPQTGLPTLVTTAQVAIDVVASTRYKYTWVQDTTRTGRYYDTLTTLAGAQVMSLGSGLFAANAVV